MCLNEFRWHSRRVKRYTPSALLSSGGGVFFSARLKPRCSGRVMGFVGGLGNIAIVSALPLSSFLIVVLIYS